MVETMTSAYKALSTEQQTQVYMQAVGKIDFSSSNSGFCKGSFGMCSDVSGNPWWNEWNSDQRDVYFFYRKSVDDAEWKYYCTYSMNDYENEFDDTIDELLVLIDTPPPTPPPTQPPTPPPTQPPPTQPSPTTTPPNQPTPTAEVSPTARPPLPSLPPPPPTPTMTVNQPTAADKNTQLDSEAPSAAPSTSTSSGASLFGKASIIGYNAAVAAFPCLAVVVLSIAL